MNSLAIPIQNSLNPYFSDVLDASINEVQLILNNFLVDPQFADKILYTFGNTVDLEQAAASIANFAQALPSIDIRPEAEINFAQGAYAGAIDRIFLAEEFLNNNSHNQAEIVKVILEESGHAIDWELNDLDPIWDEGELFASIVTQTDLYLTDFQRIPEDDKAIAIIDGYTVEIEQATPGINPAFDLIGLTQLRNDPRFAGIDGSGFSVAVIDSGIDINHPLLAPNYRFGIDFINGDNNPDDLVSHGTHVSGTVGARDENIGVAPDVGLIGLKIGDNRGLSGQAIVNALQWVLDNHREYNITAVNMSLGGGFYTSEGQASGDVEFRLINQLEQAGITVVSAGGNDYDNYQRQGYGAPGIYSTLVVGAVWQDGRFSNVGLDRTTGSDRLTFFSQRLQAPNTIFAPGAFIRSTVPGGGFDDKPGTSMASPHVAGAVALMQEAALQFGGRTLSPNEVVDIMLSTADGIFDGDDEDNNLPATRISYPRLNIYNAIAEIKNRFDTVAPPPPGNTGGDANGTIAGAIIGPTLDGSPVNALVGSIGIDGNATSIGENDVDMYRFTLESPGTVNIEVGSHTSSPQDFDSFLRLFDASGNQLAFDDDSGTDRFSSLNADLGAGTYYVGVSSYNNSGYNPTVAGSGASGESTGNYSLQFSLSNVDPNGLISGAVAVNLGNDREPLIFPGFIGADYGTPTGVSDVDLFEIVVPDDGTLFIDIDTPYASGYVDSYLRVFDVNGNELVFSDDDNAFDEFNNNFVSGIVTNDPNNTNFIDGQFDSNDNYQKGNYGHTLDSFIAGTVERGDVYYIGVSDFFNDEYDPTNLNNRSQAGNGGLYELIVTFVNNDVNGSITQAITDASLPIINQPGLIGYDGDPQTGQLSNVGNKDIDFIKIRSATAGILEVDIDSYTLDSSQLPSAGTELDGIPVDTVVSIFDANGNLLASDDDTDNLDPLLQYPIDANTDYYVAITGYGNDNFDPFALGSGSGGDTGGYLFSSRILPSNQGTLLSDNGINNGAVQTVTYNTPIMANIGEDNGLSVGASDFDIYRFIPTVSGAVDIQTTTYERFSADTFLRLFDTNGNELAANDNVNNLTRGSLIQASVVAGTQYLIGVNGTSPQARNYNPITGQGAAPSSTLGDYTLTITQSQSFDPAQYAASNPDLLIAFGYNLEALRQHYLASGQAEGRSTDTFNEGLYLASNPDLITVFGYNPQAATRHYIESGYFEGRQQNLFIPERYLEVYPDLQAVFGNDINAAIRHYIESGYSEGRDFLTGFDPGAYIASHADLIGVFGYNPEGGRQHYVSSGYYEGRTVTFDPDEYLASNPDLLQAFGYNLQAATQHYIISGVGENRIQDNFDEVAYLNNYPDLQSIFGNDLVAATRHYILAGYFEGRTDV